ncbi:DUF4097 family beta strand repeat-containing protein [Kitasatospora brasiliensis]|uniref:DUF4097 family beta strand repeat-containing protein n=1 Tax=Kitasatospora brasiliensis TaxID=3058040 RepID=UPI00292D20F6|nr:DUF4097 family beta strand repeat-containing protein [Kitasatospora sp. K002]
MHTFDTPAPITAALDIPGGIVRLVAAERADTTVEVRPADPGRRHDAQAAEQTSVTCAKGVLRITTAAAQSRLLGPRGRLEVTVHLPAGSALQGKAGAARLRATGPLGDIDFEGAHRHTAIEEAASLRLSAVDGDVEVALLTGPARITTTRGDIRVTEAHRGTVTLNTQAGSITIGAATGARAALSAGTGHGRITSSLRNDGTTVLDIHATTHQGDITAHSL